MKIEKYVVGMISTNCYLVINEETKDTVMVDPGAYPAKLKNVVKEQGLKLKAVLLTHAHFDHIMGLSDVMEDIKVPVYVEEADLPMMMDGERNLSSGYMRGGYQFADAVPVRDGQQLQIAGFQFRVIHTPGHTPGRTPSCPDSRDRVSPLRIWGSADSPPPAPAPPRATPHRPTAAGPARCSNGTAPDAHGTWVPANRCP